MERSMGFYQQNVVLAQAIFHSMPPKAKAKKRRPKAAAEPPGKSLRRLRRTEAAKALNDVARAVAVPPLSNLNHLERFPEVFAEVLGKASAQQAEQLEAARALWEANGGAQVQGLSGTADQEAVQEDNDEGGHVEQHRRLQTSGKEFRLQSKAFMLTFNSVDFTADTWGLLALTLILTRT
jgi:hypothetical protein